MASTLAWRDLELRERLGEGQGGVVWSATLRRPYKHCPAGAIVAVKRYKRWVLEIAGQYDRIYRELVAGLQVNHPNVVRTLALIADHDALPVLVMNYYSGDTLERILRNQREEGTTMDTTASFRIVGDIASGLAAIHAAGLTHRDVKPANIILSANGAVVMDLGVVSSTAIAEQTHTTQFLGTIRYAAPEYLAGESCTVATDAFSLGAIASELFTGTEFCGHHHNWAKLVADRLESTSYEYHNVRGIGDRDGIGAAEAAKFVLESLLKQDHEQRFYDLAALAMWISNGFWRGAFWIHNGCVVEGRPRKVPSIAERWGSRSMCSLRVAKSELLRILPKDQLVALVSLLPDGYWRGFRFRPEQKAYAIYWYDLGLIEIDIPESEYPSDKYRKRDPCQFWYSFGETVRSLYRYGYLDDVATKPLLAVDNSTHTSALPNKRMGPTRQRSRRRTAHS